MGIWTLRAKPKESKLHIIIPTTRCITELNYVLTMQSHWEFTTHRVAEKDHQAIQRFPLVDKDQNRPRQRR